MATAIVASPLLLDTSGSLVRLQAPALVQSARLAAFVELNNASSSFASNLAVFASNAACFASNLQPSVAWSSNMAAFLGTQGVAATAFSSNAGAWASNTSVAACNCAVYSSNSTVWASNAAVALSNLGLLSGSGSNSTWSAPSLIVSNVMQVGTPERCNDVVMRVYGVIEATDFMSSNLSLGGTLNVMNQALLEDTRIEGALTVTGATCLCNVVQVGTQEMLGMGQGVLQVLGAGQALAWTVTSNSQLSNASVAGTLGVAGPSTLAGYTEVGTTATLASSNTHMLRVYGLVDAQDYVILSDARVKTNVRALEPAAAMARLRHKALRPVTYTYRHSAAGPTRCGFIAQEVEQVVPEAVHDMPSYTVPAGRGAGLTWRPAAAPPARPRAPLDGMPGAEQAQEEEEEEETRAVEVHLPDHRLSRGDALVLDLDDDSSNGGSTRRQRATATVEQVLDLDRVVCRLPPPSAAGGDSNSNISRGAATASPLAGTATVREVVHQRIKMLDTQQLVPVLCAALQGIEQRLSGLEARLAAGASAAAAWPSAGGGATAWPSRAPDYVTPPAPAPAPAFTFGLGSGLGGSGGRAGMDGGPDRRHVQAQRQRRPVV